MSSTATAAPDWAETGEPLGELNWAWDAPLELIQGPYPHRRWLLYQGGWPVVAVERRRIWSLRTVGEGWTAAVRRRRRRLGWHLEIARAGEWDSVLYYRPDTLLPGGALGGCGDWRYKLRGPLLRSDWTLAAARGPEVAHIMLCAKPHGEYARARALRGGLIPGASVEPNLPLLLAAACVAIVIHHQQPVLCACA